MVQHAQAVPGHLLGGCNARVPGSFTAQHPCTLGRRCQLLGNAGLDRETSNRRSFGYWQCIRLLATRSANGSSIACRLP
jgi:hypothetical protein